MSNAGMDNTKPSSLQLKPYMLADDGPRLPTADGLAVTVKATTLQTGGAFNLFTLIAPPGFSTSMHIHYAEDVAVFVLEGSLTVFWGDKRMEACAGSYVFMPKGTPQGFRVADGAGARLLYLAVPGRIDRLVREYGGFKDRSRWMAVVAHYKIEILGPLPD